MRRKVTVGPERVEATIGSLATYLKDLKVHGVPDDAKIRSSDSPEGILLVNVEYEEEVELVPQMAPRPQRENSGTEPLGLIR